ncbi:MAG: crossover junction endodeoxyribonuclease RuvC [Sedimentisphaeraceae bacterium JB056]
MKIIGIDPGLRICGYAVINSNVSGINLLEAGTIRADTKAELADRLSQIAADLDTILDSHDPDIMAVEQLYSHYAHPRTAILMGHARGVIFQRAGVREMKVVDYSATKIKKSLTGNGRATKQQMQRAIASTLSLAAPPEPADVADAIAIALCCVNALNLEDMIAF